MFRVNNNFLNQKIRYNLIHKDGFENVRDMNSDPSFLYTAILYLIQYNIAQLNIHKYKFVHRIIGMIIVL